MRFPPLSARFADTLNRRAGVVAVMAALMASAFVASATPAGGRSASDDRRPDPCLGAPGTIAAQQAAFTTLVANGSGWATADGYVPVRLPDGRTAWLMSDTLLAAPTAEPGADPTFVHNSIVVQRGRCFTPVMGGTAAVRDDLVPAVDGRACWPSSGVARATSLVMLCTEIERVDGPPGFGFRVLGTGIASFDVPAMTFRSRVSLPFTEPAGIRWGTGAVRDRNWVYVYGAANDAQYVARVRFDRIVTGPWWFWSGRTWGSRDALVPMTFARGTPAMPAFVTPTAAGYVAVAFASPLPDPTIRGWTATAPQGPWRAVGTVATATPSAGQFAYDARAVDLGRAGWTVVYNVNDPVAVATDPSTYGGRFVPAPRALRRATR